MSRDRDVSDESTSGEEKEEKPSDGAKLNALQIMAATGAATTGAIVANAMGIYGTVIGVAVFSIISSVGTVVLLQSLNRTRERLRKTVRRLEAAVPETAAQTTQATRPTDARAVGSATVGIPADPEVTVAFDPAATVPLVRPSSVAPVTATARIPAVKRPETIEKPKKTRPIWKPIAISSIVVFALTIAVLTGIAFLSGQPPASFYTKPPAQTITPQPESENELDGDGDERPWEDDPSSPSPSDSPSPTPSEEPSSPTAPPTTPETTTDPPPSPEPELPEDPEGEE
ncbi:hypothetical protein FB566_1647 [Stackebrandtia endophytica]|uniref:Uncharacterized protein n=1 Tax=Stackebrandtia endophytica TaxID=1496996 RepID=A0A543AU84_9ACTN|nr:hypothetical protein [Stackebrandtia endophytica]TQL76127.1 hypothetical protein FB566_1647 [Stackebrandtia endophytica]